MSQPFVFSPALSLLLAATTALAQPILYVDDSATGVNDGSSWCDAYVFLQDGLAAAAGSGGMVIEIRVAQGAYEPDQGASKIPGDRTATFQLLNGVAIKGGYAGCGQPDPDERYITAHETTLSGDLNGNDGPSFQNDDENSYHVVTGSGTDETALLDGFTVRGGNAHGLGVPNGGGGGGVFCDQGGPRIADCLITRNRARQGAGIHFYRSSDAAVTNCTIVGNSASHGGGVGSHLSKPSIKDCTITWNTAVLGAGVWACASNLTAVNCTIANNSARAGGGVRFEDEGRSTLTGCRITGNSASTKGGGIYAGTYTDVTVRSSIITGNSAAQWGGGVASYKGNLTLTDCLISRNTVEGEGGGLQFWADSRALIVNCTVTENAALSGDGVHCSGNARVVIRNSVLWADGRQELVTLGSSELTVGYSDVQGGWPNVGGNGHLVWLNGNIDVDPQFANSAVQDYHLRSSSPCIDVGDPVSLAAEGTADLDYEPRIANARVDIGADEYHDCNDNNIADYQDIASGTSTDCTANHSPDECEPDCNGNTVADSCDIANGTSTDCTANRIPDDCEADCNHNGIADTCDILWGTSEDCNDNLVPDECTEHENDCDSNGSPDACDTASGIVEDCDGNGVPDACEDTSADCNNNNTWDPCDLAAGTVADEDQDGVIDVCEEHLVLYVDDDAPADPVPGDPAVGDPSEDGSIAHPYDTIQEAINAASAIEDGNPSSALLVEIVVADGEYTGSGNKDLVLGGRPYLLRSANGPSKCIIDCQGSGRGFHFGAGETAGTRLRGFTIVNGLADFGGGMLCEYSSSPAISDCWMRRNRATYGGGVCSRSGSAPTISKCSISDNTASAGGGIYCDNSNAMMVDCSLQENVAVSFNGGGIWCHNHSHATITGCSIVRNTAESVGGGVSLADISDARISDCVVRQNTAGHTGGGIAYYDSRPIISHCTITGNTAAVAGGGIQCHGSHGSTITNCLIAGNTAIAYYSGGVKSNGCYEVSIENCTIAGNVGHSAGGLDVWGGRVTVYNSVLWDDTPREIRAGAYAEISVHHSDVQGGEANTVDDFSALTWGEGNANVYPSFVGPGYWNDNETPGDMADNSWVEGDYRLKPGSPCADTGDTSALPVDSLDLDGNGSTVEPIPIDLDGHARVLCGRVDIGAYESGIGDYDCSQQVDLLDFTNWPACMTGLKSSPYPSGCEAFDFEFDGDVDLKDSGCFQSTFSGK